MRVPEFAKLYKTTAQNIYNKRSQGMLPKDIFRVDKDVLYIDENYIGKRLSFRKRLIDLNQEMYYQINETVTDLDMCKAIAKMYPKTSTGSMNGYIQVTLFMPLIQAIPFRVTKREWYFYRWAKKYLKDNRYASDKV